MRSQIEYNNALLRVGQDIYEGIDLVDACKKNVSILIHSSVS